MSTPQLPELPKVRKRVPRLRRHAVLPRGPRLYQDRKYRVSGPGEPPPGFVGGSTSKDEWVLYWAVAKALGVPENPRQGPFFGGEGVWEYQTPLLGGYTRSLGSAVIDYIIYDARGNIGLRLQTERFHIYASAEKQMSDLVQRERLMGEQGIHIVDIYSQDFIEDSTGEAAIVVVKEALSGIERQNPITGDIAYRTRLGRL